LRLAYNAAAARRNGKHGARKLSGWHHGFL